MEVKLFRNSCPMNCYDRCSMVTRVENGRIVEIVPDREDFATEGFLCPEVALLRNFLDYVYAEDRILYPLKRAGKKGEGRFDPISWDEAYSVIVEKLQEVSAKHGSEAVLYINAGAVFDIVQRYFPSRFFNKYGGSSFVITEGCSPTGDSAIRDTSGLVGYSTDPLELSNSRLIVLWSVNTYTRLYHDHVRFRKFRQEGKKIVVIDPIKTQAAGEADLHIQPYPGSDAALALAMINVIVSEGLVDEPFINQFCFGFDRLKERVRWFTPGEVEKFTNVPANLIVSLAREYATLKPSIIIIGNGIEKNVNGGEMIRAISCLPPLTGNLGKPGAGFIYNNLGYSNYYRVVPGFKGRHLSSRDLRAFTNQAQFGELLVNKHLRPPIMMLFIYQTNPATSRPNLNKVIKGLSREDLFTVVHEMFPTDTTDYADIVLPSPSFFEFDDVFYSWYHLHVTANEKAIEPLGECKKRTDIFRELAKRMGFSEPELFESDQSMIEGLLKDLGTSWDEIRLKGHFRLADPGYLKELHLPTPSGKVEYYSLQALSKGSDYDPLPTFTPQRKDKLRLLSPYHFWTNHSQFCNFKEIRKKLGQPSIELSEEDARLRGIKDGDRVKVESEYGSLILKAVISDRVAKGVVLSYFGNWNKFSPEEKSINFITSDRGSDREIKIFTPNSNYVEITKYRN